MAYGRDVSGILRALLDSLGLDEEQRQRRMTHQTMCQLLINFGFILGSTDLTYLASGSTFETTTIDGLSSDVDMMLISTSVRVITDIEDWKGDGKRTYLIDSTGCHRSFVKLYLLSSKYPGPLYADTLSSISPYHEVDVNGQVLLINKIPHPTSVVSEGKVQGPAFSVQESTGIQETDIVMTLQCDSFPREARWWKQRQTPLTRTRIDPAIIDDINHCYLVGVGNKQSPTEHLEWRLSFSHIENKLIHAWNNVQYQCYVLMKFIQKDLIKPFVPDVLCSYHFKTLIM